MKKMVYFGIFFLIFICFFSCSEDKGEYLSNGTITGVDVRECSCCGGYFIDINDSTYRFLSIPSGSDLLLVNPVFPIEVKLDWAKADTVCLGDEIQVFRIKLRR